MKIAQLRHQPFILLALKDGASAGYFSPEFIHKTQQQLSDMSLRIASDNLSIIYADQIRKGCEIVLGMSNLGLLDLCDNNTEQAKHILKTQGIVYCFRAGWAKYNDLKNISPSYFAGIPITTYALGLRDISDIRLMHEALVKEGQQSARLLQVYKSIAATYSANTLLLDDDEDILRFELQKFLSTAVALLLIDSDKNVFTTSSYAQLITYLSDTEQDVLHNKFDECISRFTEQLPGETKAYLQDSELLAFEDLKGIITQQEDVSMYAQEILELPLSVANELFNDFEGGYDFHGDDEEDLAYLRPDDL